MLVVTREEEQKVVIDGPCIITVCGVEGKRVRLGFEAGPEVKIVRLELLGERRTETENTDSP